MAKFNKQMFDLGVSRIFSGFYLRWLWWKEGRKIRLFPKRGKVSEEAKQWAEDVIKNKLKE